IRLTGELNILALQQTLTEIVRRHEVLRTTFQMVEGEAMQVIGVADEFPLPVTDLRNVAEGERETAARNVAREEARWPFNLATGPLLRGGVLQLDDDDYVLLLNTHHIISDGWS